jgi:hypothetical protein
MNRKEQLKLDPETLLVGEVTKSKQISLRALVEAISAESPTFTHANENLGIYRKAVLDFSGLRQTKPAMYAVCKSILKQDENTAFPRGMDRHIARARKARKAHSIHYESPIEFTFS